MVDKATSLIRLLRLEDSKYLPAFAVFEYQ